MGDLGHAPDGSQQGSHANAAPIDSGNSSANLPDHTKRPFQFSYWSLLVIVVLLAALPIAVKKLIELTPFYKTPHQAALESVNNRDGWARRDRHGYVTADLNGGTIAIHDQSLCDLVACQKLRELNAFKTSITDAGLVYLTGHTDLKILRLDGSIGISDAAIPVLSKLIGLELLSLKDTRMSQAGIARLRAALPACEILY
ncbi:MAG: hypothetical protein M5U26_26875 [Planctomycetota bacterium]|nr:hypothetical protein [Planctomycetota bacterium]